MVPNYSQECHNFQSAGYECTQIHYLMDLNDYDLIQDTSFKHLIVY